MIEMLAEIIAAFWVALSAVCHIDEDDRWGVARDIIFAATLWLGGLWA